MERFDLHTHTTCSDGSLTPVELIDRAAERQVRVLAITDHDTVAAFAEPSTYKQAELHGIELIPGIEISAVVDEDKTHVLGLFIDPASDAISEVVTRQRSARLEYSMKVVDCLRADGWFVDERRMTGSDTVTKAHIADAVIKHPGNRVRLTNDFEKLPTRGLFIEALMNKGGKCYVERRVIRPDEAVDAVHAAGGLAILAHPVANLREGMSSEVMMSLLSSVPFDGIEAFYFYYSKSEGDIKVDEIDRFIKLARDVGLLISAGSDYHGPGQTIGGSVEVGFAGEAKLPSPEILKNLRAAL